MTRTDVLAMKPGPEMDLVVAERVFGIQPRTVRLKGSTDYVTVVSANLFWLQSGVHTREDIEGMAHPRYSTDISEAWKVVGRFEHGPIVSHPPMGHDWDWPVEIVRIADGERYSGWSVCLGGSPEVVSSSITEAICKAALLTTVKA